MKRNTLFINILLAILFLFIFNYPLFAQVQELDIYNEWYSPDSSFTSQREFLLIRDYQTFNELWKKTELGKTAPFLDFNKYMVLVWIPGYTRRDCSIISFERLLYKEGNLLLIMDFLDNDKRFGPYKRPVKIAIIQNVKDCDLFVFKKKQIGWKKYEFNPIYTLWDMNGKRKRSLDFAVMDRDEGPVIVLATETRELIAEEKKEMAKEKAKKEAQAAAAKAAKEKEERQTVRPIAIVAAPKQASQSRQPSAIQSPRPLPEAVAPKMQTAAQPPSRPAVIQPAKPSQPAQPSQPTKPSGVVSTSPIKIGGTPAPTASSDSKPDAAPGMGEDPLFGSEFDITF